MYGKNWDQYYHRTYREQRKKALWDVPPSEAIALDLPVFSGAFDPDLPLIDLGCGTGTQTAFLAGHFQQVIGVDVSAEAIKVAEEQFTAARNFTFGVLDATDVAGARAVSERAGGDANVYMRGVLHQIRAEDVERFRRVILSLLGQKGTLYCIEVSDQIREYFERSEDDFSKLPERMQQVFISNLPPRGLSLDNLRHYFPPDRFTLLESGPGHLNTNLKFRGNAAIRIPAVYALLRAV